MPRRTAPWPRVHVQQGRQCERRRRAGVPELIDEVRTSLAKKPIKITEVVLRDAHQSLHCHPHDAWTRCAPSCPPWTRWAITRWNAGAAPPSTPASVFWTRTRGTACASCAKRCPTPSCRCCSAARTCWATATMPTTRWSILCRSPLPTASTSCASSTR